MRMTRRWTTLVLLIAGGVLVCGCGDEGNGPTPPEGGGRSGVAMADLPPDLVGMWVGNLIDPDGGAPYLWIRADGTYKSAMVLIHDHEYEFDGKTLRTVEKTVPTVDFRHSEREAMDGEVEIDGDTMVRKVPRIPGGQAARELQCTRIDRLGGGADGIVGIWTHVDGDRVTYERFGQDGMVLQRAPLPLPPDVPRGNSTLTIQGDEVTLSVAGMSPATYRYEVGEDSLVLHEGGAPAHVFVRHALGAWFLPPEAE